ncbi:hypothetical protein NX059_009998 [Plenodomus lindquistii]|nr:hypothetical protein NX059_009998 [Plenodomus lindquistii]
MLRANMLRVMGPAREYQKYMDGLFANCTHGLEDSVSWNDSSSLGLLSEVLASLDSLEKDARIAISAQFSVLNRAIHRQGTVSEGSETLSDRNDGEADAEPESTGAREPFVGSDGIRNDLTKDNVVPAADKNSSDGTVGQEQHPEAELAEHNEDIATYCHSKHLKQTNGEIEEPWLNFCGANHRYNKGPMKDWKEIKNGAIRTGDEEVTVEEWLQG